MNDHEIRESPNGVDHLIVRGHCATCGMGPHEDWSARQPDTVADAFRVALAEGHTR